METQLMCADIKPMLMCLTVLLIVPTRLRVASPLALELRARLAAMFSIMLECNKLPVKATTKTTQQMEKVGGEVGLGTVPGVDLGLEMGWLTCICTHINLLLLSLCQSATFEVRCRLANKTNTNDKARAMTERNRDRDRDRYRDTDRDRQ